jgi:3-hydroxybutyryl-CoA dehydrogenase
MGPVGVVGAGTMGGGIAQISAAAGYETLLCDVSPDLVDRAIGRISASLSNAAEKGKIPEGEAPAILSRIAGHASLEALARCDMVVEAVVEDAGVKRSLFSRLGSILSHGALIATNTSSLSVTALASSVPDPGRFIGLHFFNPPLLMRLVEVVRGDATSAAAYGTAVAFAKSLGKVPVTAKDSPGFIVNRVARPFYGEALKLLGEGVADVREIDRIVRSVGGFRMGPFELMDLIGIDVNLAVTRSVYEQTFGEPRFRPHPIQQRMVDSGRLGRKSGRGFYDYGE